MGAARDWCHDRGAALLLVEGRDDCHVLLAICTRYELPETFGIHECGGITNLLQRLKGSLIAAGEPQVLGLLLDADEDFQGRWASLRDLLSRYKYTPPENPAPGGTILEPPLGYPRIGVWILPDNQRNGMLEDILQDMMTPAARTYAENVLTQARSDGMADFKPIHQSKAVVHTYLAWQDEPGKPFGQAIAGNKLNPDASPAVTRLITWIRELFPA